MPSATRSLEAYYTHLPWEIPTLGQIQPGGLIAWSGPILPPEGEATLILWRPGSAEAITAAPVTLARRGRAWVATPAPTDGAWVLLVLKGQRPSAL